MGDQHDAADWSERLGAASASDFLSRSCSGAVLVPGVEPNDGDDRSLTRSQCSSKHNDRDRASYDGAASWEGRRCDSVNNAIAFNAPAIHAGESGSFSSKNPLNLEAESDVYASTVLVVSLDVHESRVPFSIDRLPDSKS